MTSSRKNNLHQPLRTHISRRNTLTLSLLLVVTFGLYGCSGSDNVAGTNESSRKTDNAANAPAANSSTEKGKNSTTTSAPPLSTLTPLPAIAADTQLTTQDGKTFKLSEMKGKVLVLDLWATWCPPCRQGVPHLVQMNKEYGPRGVEVIGLDIDPESDTQAMVNEFAKEFSINYKLAFIQADFAKALMAGNNNIPQTFVITKDGRMLKRFVGFRESETPGQIREAVEQALSYQ